MLADMVALGGEYPYFLMSGVALLCALWVWRGTR